MKVLLNNQQIKKNYYCIIRYKLKNQIQNNKIQKILTWNQN